MRITDCYMANAVLNSIQSNLSKVSRTQEQIATSSKLLRLSDDPNVISQYMRTKATLSYNEQYDRNIEDGLSYLDMNDVTLGTLNDVISKANEYTVQAANDTYNASDRVAIAEQIDKLIDEVVDFGNATVGGKYIYAGTANNRPPFSRESGTDTITYSGDFGAIYREVLAGTEYRIDAPGVTSGVQIEGTNPPELVSRQDDEDIVGVIKITINDDNSVSLKEYNLDGVTENSDLIKNYSYTSEVFTVNDKDEDEDKDGGDLAGLQIDFSNAQPGTEYTITIDNRTGIFGHAEQITGDSDTYVVYDPTTASTKAEVDKGIFDVLFALRDRLKNNDTEGLQDSIEELEQVSDKLVEYRVGIGARTQHFETLQSSFLDQEVKLKEVLDNLAGADIAQLSIQMSRQQLTYEASLAVGSTILQTSLLNFLD